jgi:DNA phosphorothioation-associated DGQHR protein 1
MNEQTFRVFDAIQVEQPFGSFFLVSIKAEDLLKVCFTDPLRYENEEFKGTQRRLDEEKRVKELKDFVEGYDAAIPNSIIISANYQEDGLNCQDESLRWRFENNKLIIPTSQKLASIIDGQHRVFGFQEASPDVRSMQLPCSVYIDLPSSYQAFLFATINSNQKPVDKSLAYILYGFNIENEKTVSWSPDKLAVALLKKFNLDEDSPFYNHIKISPQIDAILEKNAKGGWLVSTATVVDGILRLISSNPKKDRNRLLQFPLNKRERSHLDTDSSPLRTLYIQNEDAVLYKIILNYFKAAEDKLFRLYEGKSAITKTVGIQGLFDALRRIIVYEKGKNDLEHIDFTQEKFESVLEPASRVDFRDEFYQYSGVGRSNISETILLLGGYVGTPDPLAADNEKERALFKKKKEQHEKIKQLIVG